jgi:hypothetical protein
LNQQEAYGAFESI